MHVPWAITAISELFERVGSAVMLGLSSDLYIAGSVERDLVIHNSHRARVVSLSKRVEGQRVWARTEAYMGGETSVTALCCVQTNIEVHSSFATFNALLQKSLAPSLFLRFPIPACFAYFFANVPLLRELTRLSWVFLAVPTVHY